MENQNVTRKDLVARGWSTAQIKAMPHVDVVKTQKRGRPAKLYSVEAVEAAEAARVAPPAEPQPEVSTENESEPSEPVAVAA